MDALRGQLLIWFLLHKRTRQRLGSNIFTFRWVCWGHGAHEGRLVGLLGSNISTAFLIWFLFCRRTRQRLGSNISTAFLILVPVAQWAYDTDACFSPLSLI